LFLQEIYFLKECLGQLKKEGLKAPSFSLREETKRQSHLRPLEFLN